MFAWFSTERKTTEANSVARGTVDHVSSHALGFVTTQVPPEFDDEDLSSLLSQSLVAVRALWGLYPDDVPESRTETVHGGGRSHHLRSTITRCSGFSLNYRRTRIPAISASPSSATSQIQRTGPHGCGPPTATGSGQGWK